MTLVDVGTVLRTAFTEGLCDKNGPHCHRSTVPVKSRWYDIIELKED
jgi:hypothetical protein